MGPVPGRSDSSAALTVDNLTCGHGERALFRGLAFALGGGEALRVRGVNGSGKTTLLRTIAGLCRPLAGRVSRRPGGDASAADDKPSDDSGLCFVGHENALADSLTATENLAFLLQVAGQPASTTDVARTFDALGLGRVRNRPVERLSAGQRRRVSLARLWLTDAPLWLLDEPATALDQEARALLCERVAGHVAGGGTVVFTAHESLVLPDVSVRSIELPAC
ncbi:cytochrome c biogenesis heme-transporting ATPase CcmA [Salinisphaera orenii]|uniref:cytochrome c biogenesis heme-transporting ATPase CcmA n=1 Tax=Salinisphaera orenii TaxID=856731 RepID=UPI00296ED64C